MNDPASPRPPEELVAYVTPQAFDQPPSGGFTQPEVRLKALEAALAGVELGAYDRTVTCWLAGWDDQVGRAITSLLWRARMAGRADTAGGWTSGTCQ